MSTLGGPRWPDGAQSGKACSITLATFGFCFFSKSIFHRYFCQYCFRSELKYMEDFTLGKKKVLIQHYFLRFLVMLKADNM